MVELSEKQFNTLRFFCEAGTVLVFLPLEKEGDSEENKQAIKENGELLLPMDEAGFLEEITPDFEEEIKKAIGLGSRGFRAFKVSEKAFNMFGKSETEE